MYATDVDELTPIGLHQQDLAASLQTQTDINVLLRRLASRSSCDFIYATDANVLLRRLALTRLAASLYTQ